MGERRWTDGNKNKNCHFQAFRKLLEIKRFDHITVQEIIEEANVGRAAPFMPTSPQRMSC